MLPCGLLRACRLCGQAVKEVDSARDKDLTDLVFKKSCGMVSTQACEDSFNYMKNNNKIKGKRKYGRPQKCMSVVVAKSVLSNIHGFREIDIETHPQGLTGKLLREDFQANSSSSTPSLPFHKLVSTSSTTPWPSPGPQNYSCAHADLALIRDAHRCGDWSMIDTAWLGEAFVRPKHRILLRDASNGGSWFFAVAAWPDSVVVGFPCKACTVPHTGVMYWEFDTHFQEPVLFPLCRLDGIEAVRYKFVAPISQHLDHPRLRGIAPMVRAFNALPSGPKPLLEIAAECSFWEVEKSALLRIASFIGLHMSSTSSLFDVVFGLIQRAKPGLNDEGVLELTQRRVALISDRVQWADELLSVDEAAEVLQPGDIKQLRSEQMSMNNHKAEALNFKNDFRQKTKMVAEARAKATGKATARKPQNKRPTGKYPKKVPVWPEANIPVDLARSCAPEGGTLWRDPRFGSWQGHFEPYPRIGRSWRKYGEGRSLQLVLQNLWGWWLFNRGLGEEACPIDGVFDTPAAAGASSSSAGTM